MAEVRGKAFLRVSHPHAFGAFFEYLITRGIVGFLRSVSGCRSRPEGLACPCGWGAFAPRGGGGENEAWDASGRDDGKGDGDYCESMPQALRPDAWDQSRQAWGKGPGAALIARRGGRAKARKRGTAPERWPARSRSVFRLNRNEPKFITETFTRKLKRSCNILLAGRA